MQLIWALLIGNRKEETRVKQFKILAFRIQNGKRGASHICKYICRGEAFGRQDKSEIDKFTAPFASPVRK